jgi:hypothetical protein
VPITAYQHRTIHSRNPLARFAHRARTAKALSLIRRHLPKDGAMLDFGCAGGELLRNVRTIFPATRLYGLDPFQQDGEGYIHLRSPAQCEGLTFDLITGFEVLEHLGDSATESFFRLVSEQLAPAGVAIVSAPNMLGPALAMKLLHGAVSSGSAMNYSAREAIDAMLTLKSPPRLQPSRSGTMRHKGYDWRITRARIAREFDITWETFTPIAGMWWGFNSQWFCVFRPRRTD